MALDIAMGGSTNTVLHLLAAAHEAAVDFTMRDIDRLSRRIPNLCKVAPARPDVHLEDVHRAGGVMSILGELERDDLIHGEVGTVHAKSLTEALEKWDVVRTTDASVYEFYRAAPGGVRTIQAFSQSKRFADLDLDRKAGVIRSTYHAYSADRGPAVLYGNLAEEGCIVKTAGVDNKLLQFFGEAIVFESQEAAVEAILGDRVGPGDVVVIRYEGPHGGPGMQEMLYPTSYLKAKKLGKACALITASGLSVGHISPEAAEGGLIALVEDGDAIRIDIPTRTIHLSVELGEIERRRARMLARGEDAWRPVHARPRRVSEALRAYAALTTSASRGAVRDLARITRR
jgi:dihydroxy-acid dehydratase